MSKEILKIGLPKWPALVVVGSPVTREQAAEIIVRTDSWSVGTNDRAWERAVYAAAGIGYVEKDGYGHAVYEDVDRFREECGVLSLEYLTNTRIASAYIGGPHGWCNWNGNIGCSSYNIGKWPDVETVYREWTAIAEAFPFLRLSSQLFSGEGTEDDTRPVVQFDIADGVAIGSIPTAPLALPERDLSAEMASVMMLGGGGGRERGCTAEALRNAVAMVRAKMAKA